MKIEGFSDLKFQPDVWTYVAFSCDYRKGQSYLHMKTFNRSDTIDRSKEISLNYP